jgi:hypothetical protein
MIQGFWDVTLYRWASSHGYFEGSQHLHLQNQTAREETRPKYRVTTRKLDDSATSLWQKLTSHTIKDIKEM